MPSQKPQTKARRCRQIWHALCTPFARFRRDEGGLAVAEMVLVMPIYLFCMLGLFTYWDAYRAVNKAQKASYAISDLITRESNAVSENYVNGMVSTMRYMVGPTLPTNVRITSIFYSETSDDYRVIWSRSSSPGRKPHLTTTLLRPMVVNLPVLVDGESIILVETWTDFTPSLARVPMLHTYISNQVLENFVVTRPRFVPKVCMTNVYCG